MRRLRNRHGPRGSSCAESSAPSLSATSFPILIEGLRRLEYRGYDSAGIAVLNGTGELKRLRTVGKVRMLQDALDDDPVARPARHRAHALGDARRAVASATRIRTSRATASRSFTTASSRTTKSCATSCAKLGYEFTSETDTEVIAHRIHYHLQKTRRPVPGGARHGRRARRRLCARRDRRRIDPDRIVLAREGCPVVIGLGNDENFVASDVAALLPVTREFIFLEEGDVAEIRRKSVRILDTRGQHRAAPGARERAVGGCRGEGRVPALHAQGDPRAAARRRADARGARRRRQAARGRVRPGGAPRCFAQTEAVQHRRVRHELSRRRRSRSTSSSRSARLPCWVEIASEYRYRNPVVPKNTLFVTISQSGETADTLAALRMAKQAGYLVAARDLQRARELAGARIRAGDADARRSRDRRRVHQGVHDAARGARHAGDRARQAPRHRRRARARAGAAADRASRR